MPSSRSSTSDKNIVDRTKRRSAASQVIRDVRKNVANNIDKPLEYEHERMRTYAQNHINAKIALPVFIIIVAVVSGNWISSLIPLYWSVIALLSYGLLFALSYRFMRPSDELPDLQKWRRSFLYSQMLIAFSWSLIAIFTAPPAASQAPILIVQFSTILVLQAVTMILSYGFGPAC